MPNTKNSRRFKILDHSAASKYGVAEKPIKHFNHDVAYEDFEAQDFEFDAPLAGAESVQGNAAEEEVTMNNATSTSAGVLGGDAAAEETAPSESGTGSSTRGGHPASAKYGVGTAVGYERTNAASGNESKNGEDIAMGDTESGFATAVGGKVDSTITLDGETTSGEAAHQVLGVAEHARGHAFGGEVDSSATPFGDGQYSETTDAESSLPESTSSFNELIGLLLVSDDIPIFKNLWTANDRIGDWRRNIEYGLCASSDHMHIMAKRVVVHLYNLSEFALHLEYRGKTLTVVLVPSTGKILMLPMLALLSQAVCMLKHFFEFGVAGLRSDISHGLTPQQSANKVMVLFRDLCHITCIPRDESRTITPYAGGRVLATEANSSGEAWFDHDHDKKYNIELTGTLKDTVLEMMEADFSPELQAEYLEAKSNEELFDYYLAEAENYDFGSHGGNGQQMFESHGGQAVQMVEPPQFEFDDEVLESIPAVRSRPLNQIEAELWRQLISGGYAKPAPEHTVMEAKQVVELPFHVKPATVSSGFGNDWKSMEFGTLNFIDLSSVDLQ
ncbi:hypothetical protein LTR97_012899 [Elasticomyces elasticus]|uniref:Uncharacterized protein n=1 Tax=Elasticomyces elasticus TaxID=574655 RepID=A0AAN7VLN3_9PEZI|nr:hypothetical protein LTR97_012899 [Elasticomyces elasticus]